MSVQASVSFDQELARQTKATESAQALVRDWQGVADTQRTQIDDQARRIAIFLATLNDLIACAGEDTPADVVAKCRAALGRVG